MALHVAALFRTLRASRMERRCAAATSCCVTGVFFCFYVFGLGQKAACLLSPFLSRFGLVVVERLCRRKGSTNTKRSNFIFFKLLRIMFLLAEHDNL